MEIFATPYQRLFDERVVARAGKLLAHRLGFVAIAEGAYLDVQQLVLGLRADGGREAILA